MLPSMVTSWDSFDVQEEWHNTCVSCIELSTPGKPAVLKDSLTGNNEDVISLLLFTLHLWYLTYYWQSLLFVPAAACIEATQDNKRALQRSMVCSTSSRSLILVENWILVSTSASPPLIYRSNPNDRRLQWTGDHYSNSSETGSPLWPDQ